MDLPRNDFKARLKKGPHLVGIWNSIPGNTVTEMLAASGFDWVLIDTEHSPIETAELLPALQAVAGYPGTSAVVRPYANDTVLIKRVLDMGAQTLLLPYVQTRAEAEAAVSAMRYPPQGVRGVAGLTRSSRFGKIPGYAKRASEELCLIVQAETVQAIENLEAIATVDGVDAVFIGPSDLSASMGYPGEPDHPEVQAKMEGAYATLKSLDVPFGILSLNEEVCARAMAQGAAFTAVGVDAALLGRSVDALRARFPAG
ncbi:aldolase/citrate lyase family protein [Sulfitobacter sp. D35]|uniref:HpcH/HpaI aldolase family protein n=1 Tax=Sulfitobacter sp. D35 TaxID=3083252 RepID=UPI00296F8B67|nr:aldolase/citrate lyase family protein [Sulfitobacter sp. D35]MDW4497380.1 aldolase/citrate lyase family protein [Sulfitobacter sp. D35]